MMVVGGGSGALLLGHGKASAFISPAHELAASHIFASKVTLFSFPKKKMLQNPKSAYPVMLVSGGTQNYKTELLKCRII